MNPELNNEESVELIREQHSVFKVTAVSKYLALALFVLLPFVGGYIGYVYAPEKVVEVERIVYKENQEVGISQTAQQTDVVTKTLSDEENSIDWATINTHSIVKPPLYNQIAWQYNGNIFSALPADKTYALFAIEDRNGEIIYSSVVGDGLAINGSVNSVTWGGDTGFSTAEEMYSKLEAGKEYRYKVTLGYAAEPGETNSFKELASRHISYSDWFTVSWDTTSEEMSMIESGTITVNQATNEITAKVAFGLMDVLEVKTTFNTKETVFDDVLRAVNEAGRNADYVDQNRIKIEYIN